MEVLLLSHKLTMFGKIRYDAISYGFNDICEVSDVDDNGVEHHHSSSTIVIAERKELKGNSLSQPSDA